MERNKLASEEMRKEQDIQSLGQINHIEYSDRRNSELKFMYCQPVVEHKDLPPPLPEAATAAHAHALVPPPAGEDDPLTRAFKEKLLRKIKGTASSSSGHSPDLDDAPDIPPVDPDLYPEPAPDPDSEAGALELRESRRRRREEDERARRGKTGKYNPNYAAGAVQSELEREIGRKHKGGGMSQAELEERFPQLKNAPVEGKYAGSIQVQHKPFAGVIRYVQCKRCGIWGHSSGDRECALRDHNPQDVQRQQREDPMANQLSASSTAANALELDKQKLIYARAVAGVPGVDPKTLQYIQNKNISLRSAVVRAQSGKIVNIGGGSEAYQLVESEEEEQSEGDCDMEELALLASLSAREKRLLVAKLREIYPHYPDVVSELLDSILHAESRLARIAGGDGGAAAGTHSCREPRERKKSRKH